ncbi:hypothetical protein PILCRDRAFT_7999 [Piloderma croceum F 1598]|uniref:CCHC-type domain-containing protein n=1 Tax=Piloderma croceum (strain F 1598) TaxID=765440 RepID=A0A0C3FR25_PILCF|nr:hypothetical protein PILCRDRAFT_7999 [Piloderma croceum F 1598]
MFITLLLITVLTILIYLLLVTQPTFHRWSYRYLGDEIRGYEYSFYFIILLLYFQFLSGFGNLIISKHNNPETPTSSTPPTRPATPSPPGMSEDPTRLRVPPELRRHRRQNIPIVDDTTTSSYRIPIETSPLVEESRIIDQQLVEQKQVPSNIHSHHQSLSTELDHLLQLPELESTHSSPLQTEATSPLLLLEFLCEDLVAAEDKSLHEKYQKVQTLLQFWNETPVVGTLWNTIGGIPIGAFLEKETPNETLSDYHSLPTPHLSVLSKNHFDLEPLEELMLATPLQMPTNPYLPEHADIQSEDISLGHTMFNLHHTFASLTDLYQPLCPLLGPLACPTPSALFQIQILRTPTYTLVAYAPHKSLHQLHSTTVSFCSRRGCYGVSDDTDSNDSSEEERPFHSPEPPSIEEESLQEVPEELTSLTHPFYEGRQYPPVPPLEPPPQVHLPPPPALSTNPSMSNPPPAAPAVPATPKERGCRPDPFSEPMNYELFRRQIGIFFLANPDIYDTDMHKIFFALTLLNEGPPGQWAQNYIERVEAQADQAGNIPDAAWGTFNAFMNSLRDSFADPNKGSDEFFQEFETLAGRAGYINNNAYLIDLLERKVPARLLKKVYNDTVPDTYAAYKEKIIRFDNLEQRLKAVMHHSGPKRSYSSPNYSSSSTSSHAKTSTGVYRGAGEPMDIGRNRPKAKLWVPCTSSSTKKPADNKPTGGAMRIKCFGCGKEGHMVSNCPLEKRKKRQQILLAQRVGLERTSINTDQGKGTPFAYTKDVDSSPLADETLKNSEARSPSHEEVIMLSDKERQSKDTDWIKKLEELHRRTETYCRGDTHAIMYRPSERCAGKQQQTCPTTLEHSYFSNDTEEPDSTVDNNVLESPHQET